MQQQGAGYGPPMAIAIERAVYPHNPIRRVHQGRLRLAASPLLDS